MGGGVPFGKCGRTEALVLAAFCSLAVLTIAVAGSPAERGLMLGRGRGCCSLRSNLK